MLSGGWVRQLVHNGWRYGVGLPCRHFHFTAAVTGKLHYTACYQLGGNFSRKLNLKH